MELLRNPSILTHSRFRYDFNLVTILMLGGFGLILPIIHDHFFDSDPNHYQRLHPRAGDETAASDLYGIGVRVGIYAQAAGMLLSASCFRVGGIKLTCCASILGLLASWTVLAADRQFSACEAFIVISLISVISIPASIVSPIPDDETGAGGVVLSVANLWVVGVNFWFWLSLYKHLPLLETRNVVFFFGKVSVTGWVRKLMIVLQVFVAVGVLRSTWFLVTSRIKWVVSALKHDLGSEKKELDGELVEKMKWFVLGITIFGFLNLVLTVVGVELTIIWNDLEPKNTLSDEPGQIFPLCIGLLIFVDGIFAVFNKISTRRPKGEEGEIQRPHSLKHVIELFLEGKKMAKQRSKAEAGGIIM